MTTTTFRTDADDADALIPLPAIRYRTDADDADALIPLPAIRYLSLILRDDADALGICDQALAGDLDAQRWAQDRIAEIVGRPVDPSPDQIRALRTEAGEAGDLDMVEICDIALGERPGLVARRDGSRSNRAWCIGQIRAALAAAAANHKRCGCGHCIVRNLIELGARS